MKMVLGVDCSLCICVEVTNEGGVGCRLQPVYLCVCNW